MVNSLGGGWLGSVRVLTAIFGVCSIAWAISTIPVFRREAVIIAAGHHILSGEQYSASQLDDLRRKLKATAAGSFGPLALSDVAAIRLRLVEADLAAGKAQADAASLDELETAVDAALAGNPTGSFLWLTDYWLQSLRSANAAANLKLLGKSYSSGPNEAWIAVKRNPLALRVFSSLPAQLAEQVLAEFAGLVRSGLYEDAANAISASRSPIRERFLNRLAEVDEGDRRRFAKVLEAKGLDVGTVSDVDKESARPF
jgi:hypothetical protein